MTKEEKDKLIALSDLNREDNIKYISSEAQGIAIALDIDRYAPTLCKLERAYICGRRKSEEQIAELEKKIKILEGRASLHEGILWNDLHKLEKENAELKADFIKSCKVKEQGFREAEQALERKDEQLANAKELLKKLCTKQDDYCIDCTCYKFLENMRAEAEQFLNSEVEK